MRMAGVNIGKVKAKELGPGGRTTMVEIELNNRFAPIGRDARAILRQKSLLGETYVELTPGSPGAEKLDDGGTLARHERGGHGRARRGLPGVRSEDARRLPAVAARGGDSHDGPLGARLQRLARQRGAVLRGRRRPSAPAGRAGGGAAAGLPRHGPGLQRGLARGRPAARADHERRRDVRRAGVARRRAGRDVPGLPDLPARDPYDGEPARGVRPQHRPARARPARAGAAISPRRCATSATCRPTWRSSSATSTRWCARRGPACRPPSAS